MVIQMAAIFLIVQVASAFSANAADALFFAEFGVERLPPMIVLAGFVVLAVLLAHSAGIGRYGAATWLPVATATSALLAAGSWALSLTNTGWTYPVIWVSSQAVIWLTFSVMWNGAAASCDTRQAKRLFPLFASGGVAGAILGNLLTGLVAATIGTEGLLAVQGLLLVAATVQMSNATRHFGRAPQAGQSVIRELTSAVRTIAASSLLRRVSATAFGFSTLFFLVVFPFNEAVAAQFDTASETAGFLGLFSSVATAATFLTSLLIARRLFARIGVVASMSLVPLVYSLSFVAWLWQYDLTTASVVRGAQWVAVNAIGGTAMFSLYNVLSGRRRGQVAAFVTAVPTQLGIVAGGLILTTPIDGRAMFGVGLAIALGVLAVVFGMRQDYVSALMQAVREGLVGVFRAPHPTLTSPLGRESSEVLVALLDDESSDAKLMGITALAASGAPEHASALQPLLGDSDPRVRISVLDAMDSLVPNEIGSLLVDCLRDPDPVMRSHALRSLALHTPTSGLGAARQMLDDPSNEVAATAAWLIGGDDGARVLNRLLEARHTDTLIAVLEAAPEDPAGFDLSSLLHHPESYVRRLAATRVTNPDELAPALDDPSVAVRTAAADKLTESDEGRRLLQAKVEQGTVTEAETALEALKRKGHLAGTLSNWALNETRRATHLRAAATNLETIDSLTSDYLVKVLRFRSKRLSQWVLVAMSTPETAMNLELVGKALWSDDTELRAQALEALDSMEASEAVTALIRLLESGEVVTSGPDQTLEMLAGDFDWWISTLARRTLSERSDVPDTEKLKLSDSLPVDHRTEILERMIALQRVPMFSALDPEDLELIAEATSEQHYLAGETVYERGEDAEDMLFLVSGSVEVTVGHGEEKRLIATYGPGTHVGELALLQRSKRSADVKAGNEGATALKLTATDLRAALEERPNVAIAMLTTLAERIAQQTSELGAAHMQSESQQNP